MPRRLRSETLTHGQQQEEDEDEEQGLTTTNTTSSSSTPRKRRRTTTFHHHNDDQEEDDEEDKDDDVHNTSRSSAKSNGTMRTRRQSALRTAKTTTIVGDDDGDDDSDDDGQANGDDDDDNDEDGGSDDSEDEDDEEFSTPKSKKKTPQKRTTPASKRGSSSSASSSSSSTRNVEQTSQFRDGSILRVKICNFMTYDDVEFEPGPRLNLVLGPNGTGKSSIVSALCLGLGGATKVLGRADQTRDFIKHGKEQAFVEITLRHQNRDLVIKRTLNGRDNTSKWYLNGKNVKKSDIDELIQQLNIRLDNLTQFLPQDKVARFAALTPIELLQETEEAVLPASSVILHKELIEIKKNFAVQLDKLQTHRRMLETEVQKNENLERQVKLFEERKAHLLRVELLRVREPFIQFQNLQNRANETKRQFEQQRQLLTEKQATLDPLSQQHRTLEQSQRSAESKYNENIKELRKRSQLLEKKRGDIEMQTNAANEAQGAIEGLHRRAHDRETRRRKLQAELEKERQELERLVIPDFEEQRRQKNAEMGQVNEKLGEVKARRNEIDGRKAELELTLQNVKAQIKSLEDGKAARLRIIAQVNNHSFSAWEWYKQNSHRFQKPVYLLPLSINPKDKLSARNLEHHLPQYLLTALIFESREDRDLMDREFMQGDNPRFSGLTLLALRDNATWNPESIQRPADLRTLATYGITAYLDQCIDAPPAIISILDDMARISQVAIGSKRTEEPQVLERIWAETRLETVFTPTMQYMTSTSRYAAHVHVTRSTRVRDPRIFGEVDLHRLEGLQKQRDEIFDQLERENITRRDIEKEELQLTKQQELLRGQKDMLINMKRDHDRKKKNIENLVTKIQNLEQEEDTVEEENAHRERIRLINEERARLTLNVATQFQEFCELSLSQDSLTLRRQKLARQMTDLEQQRENSRRELNELTRVVNQLQDQLNIEKNDLKELKAQAFNARAAFMNTHQMDEEEVNNRLVSLPQTLEELHEQIQAEQAAAANIADNPHVITEYEERKKKIEQMRATVEELENQKQTTEDKMNAAMREWLEPLRKCVASINEYFRDLCAHVGISGEVGLGETEDFAKFHISIKVRFRDNEGLSQLSEHRQSGGERSVTTILYLLALQSLNKCPFRVVDEINQGMDPENERKIFHQMLRSSKGDAVPQCFLITPKLLPNLVPTNCPELTVLFIYNGAWNLTQQEWARMFGTSFS